MTITPAHQMYVQVLTGLLRTLVQKEGMFWRWYTQDAGHAGLVIGPTDAVNLSDYSEGTLSFDIKITNKGLENLSEGFKLKVETTQSIHSGELSIEGIIGDGSWETINFPVSNLVASGDLQLNSITVPIVLFPSRELLRVLLIS